jgi:hypothetical protein
LVQLKSHYVQQVIEYEKKLALALEKLAHVEALLDGWSCVEELPLTTELPHPNSPTPAAFSAAIKRNLSNDEGDVAGLDSSLTSSNGDTSSAVNNSAVLTHQVNGAKSHTSIEEPFSPKLLERFKNTLDTSTRTLLSYCIDSGGIELTDTAVGGKTLSLECPNDAVFRRLKLKLPGLASKWNRFVGEDAIVVVSTATHPLDIKELSWSKEDLARLEPSLFKAIKNQVGSSLKQGVEQRLWARVTDSPGCYTKDLSLVEPASPPQVKPSGEGRLSQRKIKSSLFKLSSLMLPPYRGQSLKAALTSVIESHPGKVYCIDDLIALLFGTVEASQKGRVRDAVIKGLSEGKLQGRFESVPDSKGCYTLSISLLAAHSSTS